MKIAILMSLARMVEGEYVLCKVLKAHSNPDVLHKYLRENQLPRTMTQDNIPYVIEYGVIEDVEIEES